MDSAHLGIHVAPKEVQSHVKTGTRICGASDGREG
jgi:hypothetical protein